MKGLIGKSVETLNKFKVYVNDEDGNVSSITINPGTRAKITSVDVHGTSMVFGIEFKIGSEEVVAWLDEVDVKILD